MSCQKESVTETVKTQNTEVSANERTAGSTWTNGEPAYYDEFGLPRWNENYPRIVNTGIRAENGAILLHYFYTENDYENILERQKGGDCSGLKWGYWDTGDPTAGCVKCDCARERCDCTDYVDITSPQKEGLPSGTYQVIVRYENDGNPTP